jgi:hypothetical protein
MDDFVSFARWTTDALAAMLAGALTGLAFAAFAGLLFLLVCALAHAVAAA